ncbi:MAG TPA: peptidoglycan-binding protein [Polyangiaceae bacterium]|jgi:outer membrane protein OmpA-like peptidoglycan-associated protein
MVDEDEDYTGGGGIAAQHPTYPQDSPRKVAPTDGSDKFNTLRDPLVPVACWLLNDPAFAFDSSFVSPNFQPELAGTNERSGLKELVEANQGCPASLFGHCDPMGSDALNKTLGDRRVTAIYALLTRQVPLWEKLYSAPAVGDTWGTQAIQTMLQSLVDGSGNPYYSGPINNEYDSGTVAAVKSFQTDSGLASDGTAGAGTRKVLFGAYMDWLCTPASSDPTTQSTATPFKMQITDFLGGASAGPGDTPKLSTQSCGKFNPIVLLASSVMQGDRTTRNALDAPNRRVIMFMFKAGTVVDPSTWPCPLIGATGDACKSAFWPDGDQRRTNGDTLRTYRKTHDTMACRFYDRFARRSPCERGALKIWLQDPQRQRMPNAPYKLTVGSQTRTGNADSNGLVTVFVSTSETTATIAWGQAASASSQDSSSQSGPPSGQGGQSSTPTYLYARQIIINKDAPDPVARDYYNLLYWQSEADAQLQAFQGDYGQSKTTDDVADVHHSGTPKPEQS